MKNNLFNLDLIKDKDISQYLHNCIFQLTTIIDNLEFLFQQNAEKEHVVDILKECSFIEEEISTLIQSYKELEDDTVFKKIENHFKNIFYIQKDLITDYPDIFQNKNEQWWKFIPHSSVVNFSSQQVDLINNKHTFSTKSWMFGVFFLLPFFIFIFFYLILNNKIQHSEENIKKQSIYEYDRPFKNVFYIYSIVLKNKGNDNNFYSLIGTTSFQLPEGFVIVDKNLIVDYYLKEYYGLYNLKNEDTTIIISVTNLNFLQCKYILTKFSVISINKMIINEQLVDTDNNNKNKEYCNEEHKSNTLSIYISK